MKANGRWVAGSMLLTVMAAPAMAENRIDTVRPDAPELAAYGEYPVGVRELALVHEDQIDIANVAEDATSTDEMPRYDRSLPVEVWYPASDDAEGSTTLEAYLRDGKTRVELQGQGMRDAPPAQTDAPYPLVIVSHGYPGNRFLLSPLAENLASKGYVVVSIDHTDTTYSTLSSFASALVNRSNDQTFVLDEIARLGQAPESFLNGLVDDDHTALVGYSMGAYGTLVSAGVGLTAQAVEAHDGTWHAPAGTLEQYRFDTAAFQERFDPRIKTAVVFAPAGYSSGFFDEETMKGLNVPTLFVGGSNDDTVGYEDGVLPAWQNAEGVERGLLIFEGANHNVGAPMPAPKEAWVESEAVGFNLAMHYTDFVWDSVRMNNVSAHFVTAWLGQYLKDEEAMSAYLDLVPSSNDGVWRMEEGEPTPEHTYWTGFPERSAQALHFDFLDAER
ncbi:alpha/beta hydrolase family protein [Vreelandella sp. EE7]